MTFEAQWNDRQADLHGGPIPVREEPDGTLRPEKGIYRVMLHIQEPAPSLQWPLAGKVHLRGPSTSIAGQFCRRAVSVLIRESGF